MSRVLVLNADYRPINVCPVRRAVVLLLKEKAEAVEYGATQLRSETTTLTSPMVIRLVTYVRLPYDSRRRITRKAILARDAWACQYCGSGSSLTIDHVVPRSKGGAHEWTNVVASCWPCNKRKGSALPREVGMRLRRRPKAPQPLVFVLITERVPPDSWAKWLG